MINQHWHARFLALAEHIAGWSKDPSTKVGCVIVGPDKEVRAQGYNGFPRGVYETPERLVRPTKYLFTEHAERNAIYNAARVGTTTAGCTAYSTLCPCMDCARAIIQSGITTVVTRKPDFNLPTWGEQFLQVVNLFHETKTEILYV